MAFAFCPDDGLPRLMRYVEPGSLPGTDLLAVLDPKLNLLIINRALFELLSKEDQHRVLRTQKTSISVTMDARLVA